MTENPKKGDLMVWWVAQVPMEPIKIPVPDAKTGAMILNVLAEYDAYQYLNDVKPDYCNAGGLIEWTGTSWDDWMDDEEFCEDPTDRYPMPSLGWCSKLN
jgi:hypothetical protein